MMRSLQVGLRYFLLCLLILLTGCNSRPSDIFLPIIIGEATAAPTILDTPVATPTTSRVTRVQTPRVTRITQTPSQRTTTATAGTPVTPVVTPIPRTRVFSTPGTGTPIGLLPGQVTTPRPTSRPTITLAPTETPTSVFFNYFAIIVAQLQRTVTPTATPMPAPIVLTPTPHPVTPTEVGTPTNTPTPFTGNIRLLERDPIYEDNWIPVIAYAEPDSRIEKSWSTFYQTQPGNSDLVRIYASDSARVYDPVIALTSTEEWLEGVCMAPSTMVGVQFWGDENDGWARVLVDGVERWRGNTYGRSPELFVRFLEIRDLHSAPHVVRVEPVGQPGTSLSGGNVHVSIYAVVCGLTEQSEIFVPILQR